MSPSGWLLLALGVQGVKPTGVPGTGTVEQSPVVALETPAASASEANVGRRG